MIHEAYEEYFLPYTQLEDALRCLRKGGDPEAPVTWGYRNQIDTTTTFVTFREDRRVTLRALSEIFADIIGCHPQVRNRKTEHEACLRAVGSKTLHTRTTKRPHAGFFAIEADDTVQI